jgi:ribose 1,5-bisphosphokinase
MEAPGLRQSPSELLGPGRLVLVVGPSGAGKDTLINGARLQCANEPALVFPRRIVTRPSSAHEEHDTLDLDSFNRALADGRFALWWEAHGHRYGVPISIDDDVRCGRTVVCNVSRAIVDHVRRRYAFVSVVLITAPRRILMQRLQTRERQSDGNLIGRVARSTELEASGQPDYAIHNVGSPMAGISRLLDVIRNS